MAPEIPVLDPDRLLALDAFGILDTEPEQGFDDIVHLTARLCATPVALVSFVDRSRQWFKARVGFPACETDLGSSVCRFVLNEPDLLIIPDLALDPRTASNPLVRDPGIRFYAGAPLRTRDGQVLGSLCAIDTSPRPEGLTEGQADDLRRLARQVMAQLEASRSIAFREAAVQEREAAQAREADARREAEESDQRWRRLFEQLEEGFILGEVIRDATGRICDWRYLEVNPAWGALVGADSAEVRGRTIRETFPDIEDAWVDELAWVVDTGGSITFTSRVGSFDRWYEGRAHALTGETFVVLFLEVTERVQGERALGDNSRRNAALVQIGDRLRELGDIDAMAFAAAEIMGRTLGADRAGYGAVDLASETVAIQPDWRREGVPSVAGVHHFRDYGSFLDDLKQGELVVVQDVRTDPRTRASADAFDALGVRTLVNVPLLEHGRLVALQLIHYGEPQAWTGDDDAFVRNVADRTRIGIAQVRAREQQAFLNHEISHRLKNTMAMVQAIASQTLKTVTERDAVQAFDQRLRALSGAHDLLLKDSWTSADLCGVVTGALGNLGQLARCDIDGPTVVLGPRATLSTSLLLHELATNAMKYGALSTAGGRAAVAWTLRNTGAGEIMTLTWTETGGPPTAEPTRRGFGSRLLKMGLVGTGGATLSYASEGLRAVFEAPLAQLSAA